jgi:hypothetical protein
MALMTAVAGCASSNGADAWAAKREAQRQADRWDNRLVPVDDPRVTEMGPIAVDGREVVVRTRPLWFANGKPAWREDAYLNEFIREVDGPCYELVDAVTGDVLLPADFWTIVVVPEQGVFVKTPDDRLAMRPSIPEEEMRNVRTPWKRFDLDTGDLVESDVYYAGRTRDRFAETAFDPRREVAVIQRYDDASDEDRRLTQARFVPPIGSEAEATTVTRINGEPQYLNLQSIGQFTMLRRTDEDGTPMTMLLVDEVTPWVEHSGETRTFDLWVPPSGQTPDGLSGRRMLGLRAPGTADEDNLWLLLGDDGMFGAPDGAVGFRPIDAFDDAFGYEVTHRWLMHWAEPRADGTTWELLGPGLETLASQQRFRDVVSMRGPYYDVQAGGVLNFKTFAAVQPLAGDWRIYEIEALAKVGETDGRPTTLAERLDEVPGRLMWLAQQEGARVEARRRQAIEQAFQAALAGSKWQEAFQAGVQRGGDSMARIARTMSRPSINFLKQLYQMSPPEHQPEIARIGNAMQSINNREAEAFRLRQILERQRQQQIRAQRKIDLEQNRRRAFVFDPGRYRPGRAVMPARDHMSPAARRRYQQNISYSQHAINMGWQSPYHFD